MISTRYFNACISEGMFCKKQKKQRSQHLLPHFQSSIILLYKHPYKNNTNTKDISFLLVINTNKKKNTNKNGNPFLLFNVISISLFYFIIIVSTLAKLLI